MGEGLSLAYGCSGFAAEGNGAGASQGEEGDKEEELHCCCGLLRNGSMMMRECQSASEEK